MQFKAGDIVEGKVVTIKDYGAFVALSDDVLGMIHISEISDKYVTNINDFIKIGDSVKVKILNNDLQGKISLSIKQAMPKFKSDNKTVRENSKSASFEEMLNKFKAASDEKFSDLKYKNSDNKRSRRGSDNI